MLTTDARNILRVLVERLSKVIPEDMRTFVGYGEVHDQLGLHQAGGTIGQSLQIQGLESLARWAQLEGFPAIDGVVIDKSTLSPGKGFYQLHGQSPDDFQWWIGQVAAAKGFDWTPYLEDGEPEGLQAREALTLLGWLQVRASENGGIIRPFTTEEAMSVLGKYNLQRYGKAHGNVQSRIDFACYRSGLPPLGLTSSTPFERAWSSENRNWNYPISEMQAAAMARHWSEEDFDQIRSILQVLPGQAWRLWRETAEANEEHLRNWANSFGDAEAFEQELQALLGRPRRGGGIAPNLTAAQRKAVEDRAMAVVRKALEGEGWEVEDTSLGHPFDFRAQRLGVEMHVEVKGTSTAGERVVLTRGEVNHHRHTEAVSALYIVSGIELTGTKETPVTTGGILRSLCPWSIDDADLEPLAFRYSVPIPGGG